MTTVQPRQAVTTVRVGAEDLEATVRDLIARGMRLADMFAGGSGGSSPRASRVASDGDATVLRLVWAGQAGYVITETTIDGEEYPALSEIAPAAFVEECEIYEQFGIRPATGKPLNRMMLPPHAGPGGYGGPREYGGPGKPPVSRGGLGGIVPPGPAPHAPHTVGGHAFEFPFGPVRQVGTESLYYGLVTSGEEVVDLYLFTWHKHRGVEWRLRGKTPHEAMFLAERAEGLSAVAVGWAFAAAVEAASGIRATDAAERTRAVALELERLYNHAAATAALCQSTGLSVGQSAAEIALERFLRLNAAAFGHRYLFGVIEPGGAARSPDRQAIRQDLPGAYDELRRAADALLATNSFVDRLEATGILTRDQASDLGLVGPVARATGLVADARRTGLAGQHVNTATRTDGDVLARFNVMLDEAAESVRLIGELIDAGTGAATTSLRQVAGTGLGWAESPRGEALAWVALNEAGRITRARLRPASARNWRGFDDACRSQNVFTDIPIIEASFWLTVAGMAR